ncbi:MAG: bifunctional chorismate mutase/prephenate dehydrogenase [Tolypothrix carrinoi HA7290-LM1]|jgi:prephenate dehydrogenase/chorismate mutase/prephenate dehydrogenase|nr:bifunctional chorismate mutase/prephenate dehydrogenase [Tolypothrix carrinoi HA7290-LM1]
MIPDKLKQTDQNIIELLRDRLSLQATSELPSPEEQLAYIAPQLAQAGIPECVWASIINSHAITTESSKVNNVKPMQITIIGGLGRMGRFFTQQLLAAGHNVSILENDDWEYADQLLNQVDLVLISVPIERTVDVIKRAAKYLTPTTAICDITSIKTQPVAAMLAHHPGPVIGLHPMFGPNIKSFSKQKVVVCPGRENHIFQWFLDLIKSQGGELIVCTPEEHDQMMVIIQATQHFSRFSLGVFLAQERIDIERSLSMSSPSYRQEIDIVKRLFAQNPNLCIDIMLATEERCQEIRFLAETYSRLATLVEKRDRAGLIQEFETAQTFFTEDKKTHLKGASQFGKNIPQAVSRWLYEQSLPTQATKI